jgi:hypothetical protein
MWRTACHARQQFQSGVSETLVRKSGLTEHSNVVEVGKRAAIRHFFYAFILDALPTVIPARRHDTSESGELKWANRQSA